MKIYYVTVSWETEAKDSFNEVETVRIGRTFISKAKDKNTVIQQLEKLYKNKKKLKYDIIERNETNGIL